MEDSLVLSSIARQYQASLKMLREAIELCPEELWVGAEYCNPFWRVAYHTLFYAHLYVQASEEEFQSWPKHRESTRMLSLRSAEEPALTPYSKADILEYHDFCCAEVAAKVLETKLDSDSGFYWLPFNKFELQLYNIRHIQHHTGQLTDRLRDASDVGVRWVGR
jgi:hypothetical protein